MSKPLTYKKPSGEWGIEGVDLSALPPAVYGALCKLNDIEHPACTTNAERLRSAQTTEEMARIINGWCTPDKCMKEPDCESCGRDWLEQPYEEAPYECD